MKHTREDLVKGLKFTVYSRGDNQLFTLGDIKDDEIVVEWEVDNVAQTTRYTINYVLELLDTGKWILEIVHTKGCYGGYEAY